MGLKSRHAAKKKAEALAAEKAKARVVT